MPEHLSIGVTSQTFKASFANSKNAIIAFDHPFTLVPDVQVTLGDTGNSPAARTSVTKTGCTIKLQTNWTGQAGVIVTASNRV